MNFVKSIHWDITKRCNLRCEHCYNAEKYFEESSDDYIEKEMGLDQCIKAVHSFYDAGFRHIHMLGGEPLAAPYLYEIIKAAKELEMVVTINSNAVLLTPEVQDMLIDLKVDQFASSLDGCTAAVNDSIRGEGTFEKVIKNMKAFNKRIKECNSPLETVIVFCTTKKNLDDLMLLPALANEIGVDLISLTTFIESGQGKENRDELQVDIRVVCDAIEKMISNRLVKYEIPLQIDMRPRICEYFSHAYNANIMCNIKNSMCCAGEDAWYIEANGDVHPCLAFQLESGKKALQNNIFVKENINITETEIKDIVKSTYWKSFLSAKRSFATECISTCKDCLYLKQCQPCFFDYGSYQNPVHECEWVKEREEELGNKVLGYDLTIEDSVYFDRCQNMLFKKEIPMLSLDSEVSIEIWNLIEEKRSIKAIFDILRQEYEVKEEQLKLDIAKYMLALDKKGIIDFEKEDVRYDVSN
ncbi:MAG: radical SAM protein [Emergencia sp.]|nr:radical SAM protein [Emergencia sp.]